MAPKYEYSLMRGFFAHETTESSPTNRMTTFPGFGLVDRAYPTDAEFDPSRSQSQWERFSHYLRQLNTDSTSRAVYKLVFAARHGQGVHNEFIDSVPHEEWENKWALLDGNGIVTWFDAELTPLGRSQALAQHAHWRVALGLGAPAPQRYLVSPLRRCCETARLTFAGLTLPADRPFRPLIKELLRERLHMNTCDKRSTRTEIARLYPDFEIEAGFVEEDALFKTERRETQAEHSARTVELLDDLFESEAGCEVLSFTFHSGSMRAFFNALGAMGPWVQAGTMLPVFIKAELKDAGTVE